MSRREKSPGESDNPPNRGSRNSVHHSNSGPLRVHPAVNKILDSWVRRCSLLSTTSRSREEEVWLKQGIVGEKSRFLGGSVLPLWARNLSASSSSRRVRSGFYKIWQSVSQCGALSRVKYLDVLPSNSQNGCLVSSVDFLTSLGVTPGFPFQ